MSVAYCLDTNVLLRLQDVNALHALGVLADCRLVLTDIVWDETTRKAGVGAAAKKTLSATAQVSVHEFLPNATETHQFARLRAYYPQSTYHDGELSVIALAAVTTELVPVVFERRGHVAACDELRRPVLTGHWFFSELRRRHGLPDTVFDDCVSILHSKSYLAPTWYTAPAPPPTPPGTVPASAT